MKRQSTDTSLPLFINPMRQFDEKFPFFRQPKEVGTFSQDESRTFRHDNSSLKYYCAPNESSGLRLDLTAGYDTFIKKDESVKEKLDDLLKWILLNQQKLMLSGVEQKEPVKNSLQTDFICWRGLITRLLCTPYEQREGWIIAVIHFNGTYYLCEFDTAAKQEQKKNESRQQKIFQYGGFKFEQYLTSDSPSEKPDTTKPVNNKEGFCSVVNSKLDQHSLVFGGEVDCYVDGKNGREYVELKTSRETETPNQLRSLKRYKLLKWWCQSFLLGIPQIICGFRDDDCFVNTLKTFKTSEIPKYCRDVNDIWQPNVCFNFCNRFFSHIKAVVGHQDSKFVSVFTYEPHRKCITHEQMPKESDFYFLPDWYTSKVFNDC